jgi:hypothetical protein
MYPKIIDFSKIKLSKLENKRAQISIKDVINFNEPPPTINWQSLGRTAICANAIKEARSKNAGVFFITGAHTVKSGGSKIVSELFERDFFTQGLSNVATAIHETELSFNGETSESVKDNIKTGTFGCWVETGSYINNALSWNIGFGKSIGHLIWEKNFKYRNYSILYNCFRNNIPFSVLPSIGFDIIYCNNYWKGADIGRAGEIDFKLWVSGLYENLENGIIISVGSSVLGPQATEKAISIVNNLRIQEGKQAITNFKIFIVDIQPNKWDWSQGEPPKDHPDYYNRICKSYSRLGGEVIYIEEDNVKFLHNLLYLLKD